MSKISELIERYPQLISTKLDISNAYNALIKCYTNGGKLLVAGNGGSAADSDHIVGELMKNFKIDRPLTDIQKLNILSVSFQIGDSIVKRLQQALPAISLNDNNALTTAIINDCDPTLIYAQRILGLGNEKDVFMGISTSGNSPNIINAAIVAKSKNITVIGLTGSKKCELEKYSDICIKVPEKETDKIQEMHIPIYHCLCSMIEEYFFGEKK